ncbi:spermidine/putrescine ABC transport system ATP-binding protein PotA [Cupriavidus necator N-1]|uniref:Spermidine/putrescine import ATP-binding protein PotA n=1 Tax=Cupriavidus necator (strain ATCC 43291 / DSM 13513 / CCUG 52238 / LMG 8453 / N-1) TaxID=1042878 RepID=F8GQR4_CUPNN|nr:ABC transporter ATP-binding protein [Cupriavidus necator]AEI80740.1 spermidine/putrescine ABC transport system ATP-binding protein PotA [Cupriavidus necator N-1]MDX6009633.1 ABC transporter ATP-binding protein [Cupriavidus necator]
MPNFKLKISGLTKRYGDFVALAPTDLEVAEGEFLTLLGPSGSGKTTLLSLIAGLAVPDGGQLLINGKDVTYGAPYERDIGMVFQNYALFPHMTIAENIAFPLKMRRVDAATARRQALEALEMVRLPHVAARFPKELSGGQQQRIALARCLVYKPSIILMDEPLGALDKKLRDHMQLEIKRIHRELGTTIVYVTHDQEEAMTMSDRICLMNGGKIEQLGTPSDLYFRPRTLFVADFLGESNLFEGTVTEVRGDHVEVALAQGGAVAHAVTNAPVAAGGKVRIMVRPQNIAMANGVTAANAVSGKVLDSMITGSLTKLYVESDAAGQAPVVLSYPTSMGASRHAVGQQVTLTWQRSDAVAVPDSL